MADFVLRTNTVRNKGQMLVSRAEATVDIPNMNSLAPIETLYAPAPDGDDILALCVRLGERIHCYSRNYLDLLELCGSGEYRIACRSS
jgi:hypothetical protein